MKKCLAALAMCTSIGANAVEVSGGNLKIDEREKAALKHCADTGDLCAIISQTELAEYVHALRQSWADEIREAFQAAVKTEAKNICRNTI